MSDLAILDDVPASALVVGAHPDDCDIGCGATVAAWTRAGAQVDLLVVTDGTKGSHDPDLPDDVLRAEREAEQRAAGTVLGLRKVRFLREVDGELAERRDLVVALAAAIRELRPHVVVTHDPWRTDDLHPDHLVVGRLVHAALFAAREPRAVRDLAAAGLEAWRPEALLLMHPQDADTAVDVTDSLARKAAAVLCHRSQHATSFGLDGADGALERLEAGLSARLRGDDGRLRERFRRLELPGWTARAQRP